MQIGKQPGVVRAHRLGGGRCVVVGAAVHGGKGSGDGVFGERSSCQGWPHRPIPGFPLPPERRKGGPSPSRCFGRGPTLPGALGCGSAGRTGGYPRTLAMTSSPNWVSCCYRWGTGGGRCPRRAPRTRRWWRDLVGVAHEPAAASESLGDDDVRVLVTDVAGAVEDAVDRAGVASGGLGGGFPADRVGRCSWLSVQPPFLIHPSAFAPVYLSIRGPPAPMRRRRNGTQTRQGGAETGV